MFSYFSSAPVETEEDKLKKEQERIKQVENDLAREVARQKHEQIMNDMNKEQAEKKSYKMKMQIRWKFMEKKSKELNEKNTLRYFLNNDDTYIYYLAIFKTCNFYYVNIEKKCMNVDGFLPVKNILTSKPDTILHDLQYINADSLPTFFKESITKMISDIITKDNMQIVELAEQIKTSDLIKYF